VVRMLDLWLKYPTSALAWSNRDGVLNSVGGLRTSPGPNIPRERDSNQTMYGMSRCSAGVELALGGAVFASLDVYRAFSGLALHLCVT